MAEINFDAILVIAKKLSKPLKKLEKTFSDLQQMSVKGMKEIQQKLRSLYPYYERLRAVATKSLDKIREPAEKVRKKFKDLNKRMKTLAKASFGALNKGLSALGTSLIGVGKSGLEALNNMANSLDSEEKVQALRKEFSKLGLVLGDDTVNAAKKYRESTGKLNTIVQNLSFVIGGVLMPKISQLIDRFSAWYLANKQMVDEKLISFAKRLGDGIETFGKWLIETAPKIFEFVEKIGGLKTVAAGVALIMAGPLLAAIATFSAALMTTPLGWFIGAVALIAGIVGMITGAWNPIEKFFPDLWDSIVESVGGGIFEMVSFVEGLWDDITGLFKKGLDKVMGYIDTIKNAYDKVKGTVGDVAGEAANLVTDGINGTFDFFKGLVSDDKPKPGAINNQTKANVAGKIAITLDNEGRVKEVRSQTDNPEIDMFMDAGHAMVGR